MSPLAIAKSDDGTSFQGRESRERLAQEHLSASVVDHREGGVGEYQGLDRKGLLQGPGCLQGRHPEEIKKAYRKLARDNHPDQNPGNAAAELRFKEISEANDVLSNQTKRKEYDEARRLFGSGGFRFPRSGGSQTGGPFVDDLFRNAGGGLGSIFGGLFNGSPTTQTTVLHRPRATSRQRRRGRGQRWTSSRRSKASPSGCRWCPILRVRPVVAPALGRDDSTCLPHL